MAENLREGETITAFTFRRIRNEIIEECAMVIDARIGLPETMSTGEMMISGETVACAEAVRKLKDED